MAFESETGIKESDRSDQYRTRWSDAVAEVGLETNQMNPAYDADYIVVSPVPFAND
jgi:hypothetical protein